VQTPDLQIISVPDFELAKNINEAYLSNISCDLAREIRNNSEILLDNVLTKTRFTLLGRLKLCLNKIFKNGH
jgi:hypothetical protein